MAAATAGAVTGARPSRRARAIVIGLDSITGLQTARVLSARGISVVGLARDARHPACRTRRCAEVVTAGPMQADLIDRIMAIARNEPEPPVLFPCSDLSVLAVSHARDDLGARVRAILPAPGVIERLLDKAGFLDYARQAGVPVAETAVLRSREDVERAADTLAFPCVLKPAVKTPTWLAATSAKVFVVRDADQLLASFDRCRAWTDVLVAQEWIEGPDEAHVTCNAYFTRDSRVVVSFVSRKLRQWPLEGGVGCLSEACQNDEVLDMTTRLFATARHHGLAYLEAKLDSRRGEYVAIEPNVGRPTGRSAASDRAGIELVYTQYCDALDWPLPPSRAAQPVGRKWIYLRQDCQAAVRRWRDGSLDARTWARSLRGCREDAMFSWTDPLPFFADLRVGFRKARQHGTGAIPPVPRSPVPAHGDAPGRSSAPEGFSIHGIVGIELHGASAQDRALVVRQLGPLALPLQDRADIVLRFVDQVELDGLRWIEYGRTAFDDRGVYVVQHGKRPVRVRVVLDDQRRRCELVCERGARSVPLLMALVVAVAASKGAVPLHASAFVHAGRGILVTGWAKGGKTEALLSFARRGAAYVGDEWILISPDGRRLMGIPEAIRLQDWHLTERPDLCGHVPAMRRLAFRGVRIVEQSHAGLRRCALGGLPGMSAVERGLPAALRQLNVQLDPRRVFATHAAGYTAPFDGVCFMVSHDRPRVDVEAADPGEIAVRMAASVAYEQLPLAAALLAFRFGAGTHAGAWLEQSDAARVGQLQRVLAHKPACTVSHAYPCSLEELFEKMSPWCESAVDARQGIPTGSGV